MANWLLLECGILVIPNLTYANENYFEVMLDGMEDTEILAVSVKGSLPNREQRELLVRAVKYSVDTLINLKKIIVYSVAADEDKTNLLFEYALEKGIEIIIPNNLLKERNILWEEVKSYGQNEK